ncbi:MAG: hypothetical protein ACREU9_09440 [Gammaproteobacteria bacterium]
MKDFRAELFRFERMLRAREHFALSRYGDGELPILEGDSIDYPEFTFDPSDPADRFYRQRLLDSLRYRQRGYYVAISAPCCVGEAGFRWLREAAAQPEENLTFACLFVNSNYVLFREHILPRFREYDVILVCKRTATLEALPFPLRADFRVGHNAWRADYSLIEKIQRFIEYRHVRDGLVLICAGPFAGMLAHQLYRFCPENTYVDVGSTLDPFLFGRAGLTRGYLRGRGDHDECTWEPRRLPAPEGYH